MLTDIWDNGSGRSEEKSNVGLTERMCIQSDKWFFHSNTLSLNTIPDFPTSSSFVYEKEERERRTNEKTKASIFRWNWLASETKPVSLRLLQTFAGLHWSIVFLVKKIKVREAQVCILWTLGVLLFYWLAAFQVDTFLCEGVICS